MEVILLLVVWLFFGFVGCYLCFDDFLEDCNPLWKIPIVLIGPFSFVVAIGFGLYDSVRDYIKEVKRYYEDKTTRKRIEEKRKMRKYYEEET